MYISLIRSEMRLVMVLASLRRETAYCTASRATVRMVPSVGGERHFAVDDDACAVGTFDDDVGTQVLALFILDIVLHKVLFAFA